MSGYESCFAHLINDFVAYWGASERWNESSYGDNLRLFDHYCRANYPHAVALTQEMVDNWCRQKKTETSNSCRTRIYVVYNFVRFLVDRGLSTVCPPEIPRGERSTYIPHAFTDAEIRRFFNACDSLPVSKLYFPMPESVVAIPESTLAFAEHSVEDDMALWLKNFNNK